MENRRDSEAVSDLPLATLTTYSQNRRDLSKQSASMKAAPSKTYLSFDSRIVFRILKKGTQSKNEEDLTFDSNIDSLLQTYDELQALLSNYDQKLLQVLHRHEEDFLAAYKTHMMKVEKELLYLKRKAQDQENRLASDERILRLEKQLKWFRAELGRLEQQQLDNDHEIERLQSKNEAMEEEKRFMQDQVKAAKRQNKLLVVALTKAQSQQQELEGAQEEIKQQLSVTKKQAVTVPALIYSPFEYTSVDHNTTYVDKGKLNQDINLRESIQVSTQFHSAINTQRNMEHNDDQVLMSDTKLQTSQEPASVIQQYIFELFDSGRDEDEVVEGIEQYYKSMCQQSDEEMIALQTELELAKAEARQMEADEYVVPAVEVDDLSNFFLECIYEQRKSLRHQLLTLKSSQGHANLQNSLLKIYMNTVKTGSQKEIEQFSNFEKQKLVQLLVTNQELLNYMFDKMFKNKVPKSNKDQSNADTTNQSKYLLDLSNINKSNQDQQPIYSKQESIKQQLRESTFSKQNKLIKQNTNIFGMARQSNSHIVHYQSERSKVPLKERKQMSMEMNDDLNIMPQNQTMNDAYYSASPLLVLQSNRDQSNLRGQSGILLQRIKESGITSQVISQNQNDSQTQDKQFFSINSPSTLQQSPQLFPDIYKKQKTDLNQSEHYSIMNHTQKRSRSSYVENGRTVRQLRGMSQRPKMEIKNGKLLLAKS